MTTDEEATRLNQYKRPRYHVGERVQIVFPDTALDGQQGEVRGVDALQDARGFVFTYYYRLRMDNLAMTVMPEESLRVTPAQEETTQP